MMIVYDIDLSKVDVIAKKYDLPAKVCFDIFQDIKAIANVTQVHDQPEEEQGYKGDTHSQEE